jgi:hypothetical protein
MKIEISDSMRFELANYCAAKIHAAVTEMHLRVTRGIWPSDVPQSPFFKVLAAGNIRDIRAAVHSIKDEYERRDFVSTIKFLFKKQREESHTEAKWQDYVASVKSAYAGHCAKKAAYEAARQKLKEGVVGCIPQLAAA